jgi:hypothetical protein
MKIKSAKGKGSTFCIVVPDGRQPRGSTAFRKFHNCDQ